MLRTLPHLALGAALVSSACGAHITSKPGDIGQQGGAAGTGGQGGAEQMEGASIAAGGARPGTGGASLAAGGARPGASGSGPATGGTGPGTAGASSTGGGGPPPPIGKDAGGTPFPCFAMKPLVPATSLHQPLRQHRGLPSRLLLS